MALMTNTPIQEQSGSCEVNGFKMSFTSRKQNDKWKHTLIYVNDGVSATLSCEDERVVFGYIKGYPIADNIKLFTAMVNALYVDIIPTVEQ